MKKRHLAFVLALPILQGSGFGSGGLGCKSAPPLSDKTRVEGRYIVSHHDTVSVEVTGALRSRAELPSEGGVIAVGDHAVNIDCASPSILCPSEVLVLDEGRLVVDEPAKREIELDLILPSEPCDAADASCDPSATEAVRELLEVSDHGGARYGTPRDGDPARCVSSVEVTLDFDHGEAISSAPLVRKTRYVSGTVTVRTPLSCFLPELEAPWSEVIELESSFEGTRD